MIVLAIDASTKSTGIAVFNNKDLVYYNCINSNNSNTFSRIKYMMQQIQQIYLKYNPTQIVMQDVLPQDVKHNQNVYKALIYLQAAIVLKMNEYHQDVELVTASHWRNMCKIKTGKGIKRQQLKKESKELIKNIFNIQVNDDISDAICLGMAYVKQHESAF